MKYLLTCCLALFWTSWCSADTSYYQDLLDQGNESYKQEQYDEALGYYNQVMDAGFHSTILFYNMGNAYYKNDRIPEAILFYEKALKLSPNDPDIRFNLHIANGQILDKIEPLPELFLDTWGRAILQLFSIDGWAIACILFTFVFAALFFVYLVSRSIALRKLSFYFALFAVLLALTSGLLGFRAYNTYVNHNTAIVFEPTVTVVSEPNEKSTQLFVIHEGVKVSILEEVNGWYRISLEDGSIGWIQARFIQRI